MDEGDEGTLVGVVVADPVGIFLGHDADAWVGWIAGFASERSLFEGVGSGEHFGVVDCDSGVEG